MQLQADMVNQISKLVDKPVTYMLFTKYNFVDHNTESIDRAVLE